MPDASHLARLLHGVIEPVHAIMYFAPEVHDRLEALGMEPRGEGYVASRSAPMGAVGPGTAAATFYGFNPAIMRAFLPAVWDKATPDQVLQARAEGIQATFERLGAPEDGLVEAVGLASEAMAGVSMAGRPLAGANADVALPGLGFADLWQATAVLREHRGDGHLAVLQAHDLTPVQALALYAAWQDRISRRFLQRSRMWDDETWQAACDDLRERGWMDVDGALTEEGVAMRDTVEDDTDRLAAAPYATLGAERSRRLFDLLRPLVIAINEGGGFPRPVAVPAWD